MSQFASEKKYLELDGLKALIHKIGELYGKINENQDKTDDAIAALLTRLNLIVAPADPAEDEENSFDNILPVTDSYDYTEGTLFECVAKYIQDLRNELGATADKKDSTVYARLDQIEAWVNEGFDAEDGTHYDGLLARVAELERAAEDDFVASVECSTEKEVKENNKWELTFKSRSGKELKTVILDTSEFVIDGMLGDVKLVSVVEPGNKVYDLTSGTKYDATADEPWKTIVLESQGREPDERFMVFSFKTTEAGVPTPDFAGEATNLKNIWVSLKDLHDSYEFKAISDPTEYIVLSVPEKPEHNATGAQIVTYTAELTADAVKALDWILKGDADAKIDSYDVLNADVDKAQEDVADLQDKVINGFEEVDGDNESVVPEGSTGGTHHQDGLLTRANRLEKRATDLEEDMAGVTDWIENSTIPTTFVKAYFDYAVYGLPAGSGEPKLEDYI